MPTLLKILIHQCTATKWRLTGIWRGSLMVPIIFCIVDIPMVSVTAANINVLWCYRIDINMPCLYSVDTRTPKMEIDSMAWAHQKRPDSARIMNGWYNRHALFSTPHRLHNISRAQDQLGVQHVQYKYNPGKMTLYLSIP
jgi:hypothetical protein